MHRLDAADSYGNSGLHAGAIVPCRSTVKSTVASLIHVCFPSYVGLKLNVCEYRILCGKIGWRLVPKLFLAAR
jgi:hypothetical protein